MANNCSHATCMHTQKVNPCAPAIIISCHVQVRVSLADRAFLTCVRCLLRLVAGCQCSFAADIPGMGEDRWVLVVVREFHT